MGLVEDIHEIERGDEVAARLIDGTLVKGRPSRIDRDEAGVRIEVCPYRADDPQYRLRADRTPTGWRNPCIERRPMNGEWERYGRLVDLE